MTSLRRFLRSVALASLPAIAGCSDGFECPPGTGIDEVVVELDQPNPERQTQLDTCRDEGECEDLCQAVLRDIGVDSFGVSECELTDAPATTVRIAYFNGVACGRRPDGFEAPASRSDAPPVGRWFAHAAALEAAAVDAFDQLARELEAHGAPAALQQRARRAARDEMRHTRIMQALALRFGAEPLPPTTPSQRLRPLLEVALDNAAEGCVRESYGASVAYHQAHAASDPAVRAALAAIADDEASHAELSWDIDRWFLGQASPAERAAVREARADAVASLQAELDVAPDEELVRHAGLPDRDTARAMLERTRNALWASA